MLTEIIKIGNDYESAFAAVTAVFGVGGIVAVPTDTVYGLVCPAESENGIREIYNVKNRDVGKPLIRLVSSQAQAERLVPRMSAYERDYAARHWKRGMPPLTIVFENGTAVRMLHDGFAACLITRLDTAVVAPSANTQGTVAPVTAAGVYADLGGKIPLIIDGGRCGGVPSRIVKITDSTVTVIRE